MTKVILLQFLSKQFKHCLMFAVYSLKQICSKLAVWKAREIHCDRQLYMPHSVQDKICCSKWKANTFYTYTVNIFWCSCIAFYSHKRIRFLLEWCASSLFLREKLYHHTVETEKPNMKELEKKQEVTILRLKRVDKTKRQIQKERLQAKPIHKKHL